MLKMKDVLNGMVSQAERGEAAFYAFGGGLVMREMGALGGWEEVNEAGPDWAGYLCRRYIWFVKGGG